jgi:hypothetical protein
LRLYFATLHANRMVASNSNPNPIAQFMRNNPLKRTISQHFLIYPCGSPPARANLTRRGVQSEEGREASRQAALNRREATGFGENGRIGVVGWKGEQGGAHAYHITAQRPLPATVCQRLLCGIV